MAEEMNVMPPSEEVAIDPVAPSLEEKFMNIVAELEARIEKLEADALKLKSGMPQIAF